MFGKLFFFHFWKQVITALEQLFNQTNFKYAPFLRWTQHSFTQVILISKLVTGNRAGFQAKSVAARNSLCVTAFASLSGCTLATQLSKEKKSNLNLVAINLPVELLFPCQRETE